MYDKVHIMRWCTYSYPVKAREPGSRSTWRGSCPNLASAKLKCKGHTAHKTFLFKTPKNLCWLDTPARSVRDAVQGREQIAASRLALPRLTQRAGYNFDPFELLFNAKFD